MKEKPQIVVVTPVRNEAWVLDAFLTCASSWADHIIIADHHSTDGSREIAKKYAKVTLIDNPTDEWYENECRAKLLEEACKIPGEKIIFGLDADEFLSEGFAETKGWERIMKSNPNTIFCFRWRSVYDDMYHICDESGYMEWAAHYGEDIDVVAEYRKREHNAVHCSRVPCLEEERADYVMIDDIRFVHLAKLNKVRTQIKLDFYQVTWADKNPTKARPVSFYRTYSRYYPDDLQTLQEPVHLTCHNDSHDYSALVKTADYGKHYIDEMVQVFEREGYDKFLKLNIWSNPYLLKRGISPHRSLHIRMLHWYLNHTDNSSFIIRWIDKILNHL
ncbi:MAG: glycosyltransferase family 2 protein [Paludibacteraceae bacterium]|nr:glycosyltransferase family 2 protein [Paludibacteraceae bacterium]